MKQWLSSLLFTSFVFATTAAQAADAISTTPLNVRSGPGKRYGVHTVLPPGYPVTAGSCTRHWCQVSYNGYNGWAALRYLAFKEGGAHYNNPALGPHGKSGPYRASGRRYHKGMGMGAPNAAGQPGDGPGWWNDYQRKQPNHGPGWQPRWWQRH